MKEQDDRPEPDLGLLRPREHFVTPARHLELQAEMGISEDAARRAELIDLLERAVVVEPPPDRHVVGFGATVEVEDDSRPAKISNFTIVDESEDDIPTGRISHTSPLARALEGAHVGRKVTWHRPAGDKKLKVRSVRYD